jgi:hypothetical protein
MEGNGEQTEQACRLENNGERLHPAFHDQSNPSVCLSTYNHRAGRGFDKRTFAPVDFEGI